MKSLTLDELTQIAESVGQLNGWDFSRVHAGRAPVLWDYVEVVRHYLGPTAHVLDIGTGGGEIFFSLASNFGEGVGVDQNPTMVATAQSQTAIFGVNLFHPPNLRLSAF